MGERSKKRKIFACECGDQQIRFWKCLTGSFCVCACAGINRHGPTSKFCKEMLFECCCCIVVIILSLLLYYYHYYTSWSMEWPHRQAVQEARCLNPKH